MFHKHKWRKDWYNNICKNCNNRIVNIWYKNNKIKVKEYNIKNRDKKIEYMKSYKEDINKKKIRDMKYRNENKNKLKEYMRNYYNKHSKRLKLKSKDYYNSEKWKQVDNLHSRKRRALKYTTDDWTINIKSLNKLLEQQDYKCNICGCSLLDIKMITITWKIRDWKHLDHIIPLTKKWLHSINNVQ